jgi:hypothetical protein
VFLPFPSESAITSSFRLGNPFAKEKISPQNAWKGMSQLFAKFLVIYIAYNTITWHTTTIWPHGGIK